MRALSLSEHKASFLQISQQAFNSAEFYSMAMPSAPVADKRKIARQILHSLKQFLAYSAAASTLEARD